MNQEIEPPLQSEDAEDLIPYLPSEIMLNILSRIPARTVIRCKCVCKAWRNLLETHEFVKSYLSKFAPSLAIYLWGKKQYRIVEFVDKHCLNTVFSIDLPFLGDEYIVKCSANGLLFVCNRYWYYNPDRDRFVCNPITREYIRLPSPLEPSSGIAIQGFGVSKMSGEYKVVRMVVNAADCQVYTVGTGSWRKIEFPDQLSIARDEHGAFLNGNLHWLAYKGSSPQIYCLDLETERFSTFYPPPNDGNYSYRILSALGDYLCVSDTFVEGGYIDIWLMKHYGDEKSWTKEFVIQTGSFHNHDHCPIKVFNDGDILLQWTGNRLLYSSKKHNCESIQKVDLFMDDDRNSATVYAPSFLPLKTFGMENVSTF